MKNPMTKVLILSGDLGDGHQQAANALLEATLSHYPNVEVTVVNFMEWTHPYTHQLGRYLYVQGVQKFPSVYGYIFEKTRRPNIFSQLLKRFRTFGLDRMVQLLHEMQPSVVVSTFPIAAAAMSLVKEQGLISVPTVTVITDHTDHSYWVNDYTDQYIVGSESVRCGLRRIGVADSQIVVTGIPIHPAFCQSYHRENLRDKYKLHPTLPVVMVMGGGCGIIDKGLTDLVLGELHAQQVQFIIVCGRNDKLRQKLTAAFEHRTSSVLVTGFVDHIHELMAISDLIITKPGGLSTSEALALELPMLLYKPLAGQEQDNAAYLISTGAAIMADNETDLLVKCTQLLQQPSLLADMKEKTRKIRMTNSVFQAMDAILLDSITTLPLRSPILVGG